MRKLNKEISLATEYKEWFTKNKNHLYNSSANDYYYDVLYELLIIQNGVCAYTEYRLIDEDILIELKKGFVNGKYTIHLKPSTPAHLEHFNKLKKKISTWDWDNFFAVFEHVNFKKNHLEDKLGINNILKPDLDSYDPIKYLKYDKDLHMFYPDLKLSVGEQGKVKNMITVLGLNNDFIKMKRKEYLNTIILIEYYTEEKQTISQFYTAYSMIER